MILPVFAEELRGILRERRVLEFHIVFYTDAFICSVERWLRNKECIPPEKFVALLHSCVQLVGEL